MIRKIYKSLKITLVITSLTLALTACGNKEEVDYVDDGTASEISENLYEYDVPEHLTYEIDGAISSVNVDADIFLPDNYKECSVVEFAGASFVDEDITRYADMIFDKDSYFLFMPYSREQLEFLINKLTNIVEETEDEGAKFIIEKNYLNPFKYRLSSMSSDEVVIDGDIKFYEYDYFEDIDSIDELPPTYVCTLVGTINGSYYKLSFQKIGEISSVMLSPFDREVTTYDVGNDYYDVSLGNKCTYTKEEAEKLARDYVDKLGVSDMVITRTSNVNRMEAGMTVGDGSSEICGYTVYFGKGYEGYSLVYSSDNYDIDIPYYSANYWYYQKGYNNVEFVQVYVDNNGVSGFMYVNPLGDGNIITENAVLLPFESVQEMADVELKRYADNYKNKFDIVQVELGYSLVSDGDKRALVPAWYFFTRDDVDETKRIFYKHQSLVINAIDGSVIYGY